MQGQTDRQTDRQTYRYLKKTFLPVVDVGKNK